IPPGPPEQALRRWRDDGGTLALRGLAIDWGPSHLTGEGTLTPDQAMRPLAAVTATSGRHGGALDGRGATRGAPPRHGSSPRPLLTAVSRTPADGSPPRIDVPLTAQDGFLHVGPPKLIPLPAIGWP